SRSVHYGFPGSAIRSPSSISSRVSNAPTKPRGTCPHVRLPLSRAETGSLKMSAGCEGWLKDFQQLRARQTEAAAKETVAASSDFAQSRAEALKLTLQHAVASHNGVPRTHPRALAFP